jgi:hypothetical protein
MPENCENTSPHALQDCAEAVELKSPENGSAFAVVAVANSSDLSESATSGITEKSPAAMAASVECEAFSQVPNLAAVASIRAPGKPASISPGMRRHRWTLAATALVALSVFALNVFDLRPLISDAGTIDRNFKFTPTITMPELSANYRYADGGELKEGLIPVSQWTLEGQRMGFADAHAHIVIAPAFALVKNFSQGRAAVKLAEGGKWGFIDHAGRLVIPAIYTSINGFHHGLALVKIDDDEQLIDPNGHSVAHGRGNTFAEFPGGCYVVRNDESKLVGVFKGTTTIIPQFYDAIEHLSSSVQYGNWSSDQNDSSDRRDAILSENADLQFFKLRKNDRYSLADSTGKIYFANTENNIESVSNGHVSVVKDQLYGFSDMSGRLIIAPQFEIATAFDRLIAVKDKNGVHLIDAAGKPVKTVEIENVVIDASNQRWLHEGMGIFKRGGLYGYLDATGREIIAPKYVSAYPFHAGAARVFDGSRWRFIDKQGAIVSKNGYLRADSFKGGIAAVTVPGSLFSAIVEWPRSLHVPGSAKAPIKNEKERPETFERGED